MRIIAMGVLAFLAFICKAGEPGQIHGFETYWWGILGLIGWAYGAAAVVYALSKGKLWICVAAFLFFLLLCVAHHAKWTSNGSIIGILFGPLQSGSMPAFSMAGVVTMMVFQYFTSKNEISKMTWALFAMGIVMLLVGFWLRGFWGINKIRATPAWVLICSAATIFMFLIVYNIADIWGKAKWFEIIKPGGNNTLLCYLLPYFAYAFAVVSRIHLPDFALTAGVGLVKSFLFALLIIVIAGALGRRGLRLKL
jgi:predicted acyltransferase